MTTRDPFARPSSPVRTRFGAITAGLLLLTAMVPAAGVVAFEPPWSPSPPPPDAVRPTIQYEEAQAHASDATAFTPGERVSVSFKPRASDRWPVGGVQPAPLPAGRLSGRELRQAAPSGAPPIEWPRILDHGSLSGVDSPIVGPAALIPAQLAAAVDPGGLRREVFGFLPYWELSDSSTRLDWETLSTIAYFGVGADGNGDLQRLNSDGSTTVGWSGWTSSKLTSVINAAHASGARVVLTVQSFGWSAAGVARQQALLGSATARANLARQIAAAVRDRGVDGANLDFEPIVSTYGDEFALLVKAVRTELNKVAKGYQLTFDTTGWIGNYPIETATGSSGADAVVVMGYDYRNGSSNPVGSVAPLGGPSYDIVDTIAAYTARIPASRVILGVPYYGRAWSTDTSALHAQNVSGTKNGASVSVVYGTARQYAADHGRNWDPVEGVAWTVYRRQNCTDAYGCVNPWRQLYYDDAQALGLKYDQINKAGLRGAGIWALGYDGTRTELYAMLKAKFITDTVPPKITASSLSQAILSPNGDGRLDTTTVKVSATGHIGFGWTVEPFFDGIATASVRSGSVVGKTVAFTWDGRNDAGAVVPDGPYRITVWTADASNNRAGVAYVVTVDRRPAAVALAASSPFVSPNGDGHSDSAKLSMASDEPISGTARVIDKAGATVRKWTFTAATSQSWTWNGYDKAGRRVPDGQYVLLVAGLDRAGNQSASTLGLQVDQTIKSVAWRRPSFHPKAGQADRVTYVLRRPATVTISIYQSATLIRQVWIAQPQGAGSHGWTWDGRTSAGVLVTAGTYRVVVDATTWIGWSRFTQTVMVKVP